MNNKFLKIGLRILIVVLLLLLVAFVIKVAPNYKFPEDSDKIKLILNNKKANLKKDIFVENGIVYISKEDISTYFDIYLYIDEKNNQLITTYDKHIAVMPLNEYKMLINGVEEQISGKIINRNETLYIPFSEMKTIYDVDVKYVEMYKNVIVDSYSREQKQAICDKNLSVKWKNTTFSRTVDKVKKGDSVVIVENGDKWTKVRTTNGEIGYVKSNKLSNETYIRENMTDEVRQDKISILWDYYSDYGVCPDRTGEKFEGINVASPAFFSLVKRGQGDIVDKVGKSGLNYIEWAKSNNYEVWAMVQNDGMIETTSEILNSYELRNKTIENIVNYAIKYKLDGINIDFENMYYADKDLFSRFIIELYPRLKEYGITLSVDVTAPDGSENWSLCYDRLTISKNCDYIVFMGYDQYGDSVVGTTAGYNWVRSSLDKFTSDKRECVDASKIILGIPFYTKIWKDDISTIVNMSKVYDNIPDGVEKVWDDELKQYYVEYEKNGSTYKMWIEDEESMKYKLDLVNEYNLAGAAFWESDREPETVWPIIKQKLGL